MGCDGGTIPRRDELVRLKKKPELADKHMERMAKWLHCAITQEPLRQPMVACELGRLYNKESILEYLLDKSTCDSAEHIRSLKDVRVLNLTENPVFIDSKVHNGDVYINTHTAPYTCPVTGIEMNGLYKFCFLWTCGCVMSEKALKEVKSAVCHKCGVPYNSDEIILNGIQEEVDQLHAQMEERRAKVKAQKKAKKAQKRKIEEPGTSTATNGTKGESLTSEAAKDRLLNGEASGSKSTASASGSKSTASASGSKSTASASGSKSTAAASGSKSTASASGSKSTASASSSKKLANGSATLSSKLPSGSAAKDNGYANKEFNPKHSKVYKSLFLTKGDKPTDAHWVTYNPYYAMSK